MRGPDVTPEAIEHLAGRPLVLRASRRNGCCGGRALLPVAEAGPPAEPDRYHRLDEARVTCLIDRRLGAQLDGWHVDVVGFGRWRRLQLVGAHAVDPTRGGEQDRA